VHRDTQHLHLSQSKYIVDLLRHVNMDGAKPYSAPCTSGKRLLASDGDPLPEPSLYRHIIGALQYCTLTKPDISFTVNQLCQFLHCPTTAHLSTAKRVLRYLKGTLDFGLLFTKGSLHLHAYYDSDWAGDPSDRKSTGGYGVFLGFSLISWHAKKQPVVSRSSTEAEYCSLAVTTAKLYWLRMLFRELQVRLLTPPKIWCDNMGAIALASNPIYHARTKHVKVDYHFIRENVLHKDIAINYISTHDQRADIFTKGLTSARFLFLHDKLMVVAPPIRLRGAVKTTVLAVQGVAGHGTPVVQYTPDHGHAVQGAANPTCNSLPCVASNQQSSDYAITPNQSTHSPVYHEPTITQLATASPHRPYIPLHGQRSYIV